MKEDSRLVALSKRERHIEGTVWDVTLDGTDTGVFIVQEMMDNILAAALVKLSDVDEMVDTVAEQLIGVGCPITETEKQRLNKLLQCMT